MSSQWTTISRLPVCSPNCPVSIPREIGKIQERHLDRCEIVTVSVSNPDKTPMTLSAWRDNGLVKILSTFHSHAEAVVKINRRIGANVVSVDAPSAIVAYQKAMGGGDLADHLRSTYCVQRKTYRWWFIIFYWVIDTAIINAFACQKFSQARRKGEDEEDVDTDADVKLSLFSLFCRESRDSWL